MSPPTGTPYPHLPSQADLFYLCTTLSTSDTSLNLNIGPPSKPSLLIGVLLLGNDLIQTLDIAPIDLLTMLSEEAMERLGAPKSIASQGIELDIRYVSESGEGLFSLTAGLRVPVTESLETTLQFDLILIPGPPLTYQLSSATADFLTTQASSAHLIAVMSVCTGILPLAQAALLSSKSATAPQPLLPSLRQKFPDTIWEDMQWVSDGNVWSCSAEMNGVDMMASWMREYFWDRAEAVEWMLRAAGVRERRREHVDVR